MVSGTMQRTLEGRLSSSRLATFSLWAWWQKNPARMAAFFVILAIAAIATAVVLVLVAAGQLDDFYRWLVDTTNAGQFWTDWMREHPRVFPIGAFIVFASLGALLFHWQMWAPAFLFAFVVFFLGFLGGHVYW